MNAPEIHPQQQRENPEPYEAANPVPIVVIVLTALLLVFGVVYIARTMLDNPPALGDGRTLAELQGVGTSESTASVDGAAVYAARCAACHQANGAGLPGAFPPLAGSEWVAGKDSTLAAIVLHGIGGPLTVKGQHYDGAMPAFQQQLQDSEIAAVLTYIRGQWGNAGAALSPELVATVRRETAARTTPFNGDSELLPLQ